MRASFVSTVVCYSSPGAKMLWSALAAQTVSTAKMLDQFSQQLHDVSHVPHILPVHPATKGNIYFQIIKKKQISQPMTIKGEHSMDY